MSSETNQRPPHPSLDYRDRDYTDKTYLPSTLKPTATEFTMPAQQFTASPSQYALYSSQTQAQQISPTNSMPTTPNTTSPTSPQSAYLPGVSRQLRPPKNPMFMPAALRANEHQPRRIAKPPTPPESAHNSPDGNERFLSRRATADSGKFGVGELSKEEWSSEGEGQVTALPTREHWKVCQLCFCFHETSFWDLRGERDEMGRAVFCTSLASELCNTWMGLRAEYGTRHPCKQSFCNIAWLQCLNSPSRFDLHLAALSKTQNHFSSVLC